VKGVKVVGSGFGPRHHVSCHPLSCHSPLEEFHVGVQVVSVYWGRGGISYVSAIEMECVG